MTVYKVNLPKKSSPLVLAEHAKMTTVTNFPITITHF